MRMVRLILVGVGMAVAAGVLTSFLQGRLSGSDGIKSRSTPREVVVATRDMPAGTILSQSDLAMEACPPDADARGATTMAASAIGRTITVAVRKGQMLRADDLAARGSGAAIASELQPGYRAITVTLRDTGPGVVLYPGASVDVLATVDGPVRGTGRTESMTRTVVAGSRVLAVNDDAVGAASAGDRVGGERDGRSASRRLTVTLAVTPAQAAQVELASTRGSVGIALCPATAADAPTMEVVTASSLLGIPPEPVERPASSQREASKQDLPRPVAAPDQARTTPPSPEAPKPEVAKPEAPRPELPKPVVWEVVVVRGGETEKVNFEQKQDGSSKPADQPKKP